MIAAALAAAALLMTGACSKDEPKPVVVLDGSPRVPDDEGVATTLTKEQIILDGERTYPVSRRLVSFSTYTGALEPMLGREGQYVQIGIAEENGKDVMVWMAGIAQVVRAPEPAVYYTGDLVEIEEARGSRRGIFRDGTVIQLGDADAPEPPAAVVVEIDPEAHEAVAVTAR